jgi:predicted nucleic acid-binding protein
LILFLDSSALVKLYIAEPGSDRMQAAAAAAEGAATSPLTYAEIHATFARRGREGLLQGDELDQLRQQFGEDWEELLRVPPLDEVLMLVPGLCGRYPLRGADALQLASALFLRREGLEVTFACADSRLVDAAAGEGLAVLNPAAAN